MEPGSRAFGNDPSTRFKTFPMFLAFVQRFEVAQISIRRLRLELLPSQRFSNVHNDCDAVDVGEFVGLLRLLPRLSILHLDCVSAVHGSTTVTPLVHPSLKRLFITNTMLRNGYVSMAHRSLKIISLLNCFARIDELHLDLAKPPYSEPYVPNMPPLEVHRLLLKIASSVFGMLIV